MKETTATSSPTPFHNPSNVVPRKYLKLDSENVPQDWWCLVALLFGILGTMMKIPWACWVSVGACLQSLSMTRYSTLDSKQVAAATTFAVMGFFVMYLHGNVV
eukprot:PhF_6_TR24827/c0_g1_i1/m.34226